MEAAPERAPVVVRAHALRAAYRCEGDEPVEVLGGLDLEVHAGEFVSLVGPSGCGKTTLLHLIAGLMAPSAGQLELPERARVAMVFQRPTLIPWRTIIENARFGAECAGQACSREQASALLERMRLGGALEARPHELSEGMKQRVNLARALLIAPDVLLLDEPFSALDVQTRRALQADLLRLWRDRELTIIHVTHSLEDVAALADRALLLTQGPCTVAAAQPISLARPRQRGPRMWAVIEELEAAQAAAGSS